MIITKQNLAVLAGVAKVQNNIHNLDHVMIDTEESCIYGSDGYCLYRSNLDKSLRDEDYPDFGTENDGDEEQVFIHGRELIKAEKNIPKRHSLQILQNIQIISGKKHCYIVTSDLDAINTVKVESVKKEFPKVKDIESGFSGNPDSYVYISVIQLEKLTKALKKNGDDTVKLELRGADKPLVARSKDGVFTGYVMPLQENCV